MATLNDLPCELRLKIFKIARQNAFHNVIKKYESLQLVKPKHCKRDPYGQYDWIWSCSKNRSWIKIRISEPCTYIMHSYGFHCENSKLNISCVWANNYWIKIQNNNWQNRSTPLAYSNCACVDR